MKTLALLFSILFGFFLHGQESAGQLVVKVHNIKKIHGKLAIGVFDNEKDFLKKTSYDANVRISASTIVYTFEEMDPGIYALSVFHDENENGELDSNFMGIPSEPYGFSNDAKGVFGPPNFDACTVEVRSGRQEIVINL